MHNFDRTTGETEFGFSNEFSGQNEMFGESYEMGLHEMGQHENEYNEMGFQEMGGFNNETSPLHETMELELASELLEIQNEAELEQFLGKLMRKVASGAKSFVNSSAGKALGGMLKSVAKKALPIAGAALGNMIVPGIGGMIGGKLASAAGNAFGLELEGLSAEDREFEMSRAYVRFAANAARRASSNPNIYNDPIPAVRSSVYEAARTHAPGLISTANNFRARRSGMSGRWVRRGNSVILYGV
jgi:hypothetical protein